MTSVHRRVVSLILVLAIGAAVVLALSPQGAYARQELNVGSTMIEIRIAIGSDDAEESGSGSVSLGSSDLELVEDAQDPQTIGLLFREVAVPPGATIEHAEVQFQTDETNTIETTLTIAGQAHDNPGTFSRTQNDITSRATTTANVTWQPLPWNVIGEAGPDQRTPDLAPVIQEIIDRPGWQFENTLALIIDGSGERTAESFNGVPAAAPLLRITYSGGIFPTPTPTPTPLPPGISYQFAVIGDYGDGSIDEGRVADLVAGWNPAFVITTGDNNYDDGLAETIDPNIGQFYSSFIGNYQGVYGPGSDVNRFWPSLGNHDWQGLSCDGNGCGGPYFDYFTLPGNERYYTVDYGLLRLFALDSEDLDPDGNLANSVQAAWLQQQLAESTACFNIVYLHHPPYSSGNQGNTPETQWPFAQWGADVVMAGHDHSYERLDVNGLPYFVNGLGGAGLHDFLNLGLLPAGVTSVARYNADYGAMLVTATEFGIEYQFHAADGTLQDILTVPKACSPAGTPTPGATHTPTPTSTPLPTASNTPLPTATSTPLPTATNTPLPTATSTPLPTATNTPLPTATNTPLPTATNTPLATATSTPLPTATNTPLPTATNTPLPTATDTPLPTATNTPLPTATNTPLPTATNTPLPTATNTPLPTATNTPLPTATNTPLPTATNTPLPTATNTPLPTATNTPLPTATNTPLPTATNTPLATATNTPTPTATNTPAATSTATSTSTSTPTPVATVFEARIETSTDDAEQSASGNVSLNSSDLEIVTVSRGDQAVGMRFQGVTIPAGATITSAYIQFQVDESTSGNAQLQISGQAADDVQTFAKVSQDITSRPATVAQVAWSPSSWPTVGAAGPEQRTPNIAAVIQEIVGRSGWSSGNSLAVFITGTGTRTAEAYDGNASGAPLLHIEYTTGSQAPTATATNTLTPAVTATNTPTPLATATSTPTPAVTATNTPAPTAANTPVATNTPMPTPASTMIEVQIGASSDDAEQAVSGNVSLNSSDLELVTVTRGDQAVGMRFQALSIPAGATISSAYIQFQVDESTSGTIQLSIIGQAADNAPTFDNITYGISSRPTTNAEVTWSPPSWPTVGAAGEDQRTPDIAAIIQEIVSRPGWSSGNSLVVIITGTGTRVAESYNGNASGAPLLHVEFETP